MHACGTNDLITLTVKVRHVVIVLHNNICVGGSAFCMVVCRIEALAIGQLGLPPLGV